MTPNFRPSSTCLMTCRIRKIHRNEPFQFYQYLTIYSNEATTKPSTKSQLMIIPFPRRADMDLPTPCIADIPSERLLIKHLTEDYPAKQVSRGARSLSARSLSKRGNTVPLARVNFVNGYKISIVNSFDDLKDRVRWDEFDLSPNHDELMSDIETRYGIHYGFVVAEPHLMDGKFGGTFGFVWYGTDAYLPTAHEKMQTPEYDFCGWFVNCAEGKRLKWETGEDVSSIHQTKYTSEDMYLNMLIGEIKFLHPENDKTIENDFQCVTHVNSLQMQSTQKVNANIYLM